MTIEGARKWWALVVLCLGQLMFVLDTTIVNVALPSIRTDLEFTETSLVWVVNAYMLTFSGFLLLGGRLGDLFGARRLFLIGITIFTLASLACGFANTQLMLIVARAIQGVGGAIVAAIALSLVMALFVEEKERAKAMGIIGFISAGGGAIGVFLGGVLTGTLNWHWIFLVNIPIGIVVFVATLLLIPKAKRDGPAPRVDFAGAFTITAALMLAVYGIVNGNAAGWLSVQTLACIAAAILLGILFVFLESRVRDPLMPLKFFTIRSVIVTNIVGILWSAGMFAWFFTSALYMQVILHYSPLKVGLAFVPANVIMAVFSLGLSAMIVNRFGYRRPLTLGMVLIASGLALFSIAPVDGDLWVHVIPPMILMGLGAGIAFNPVLLAAMSDVPQDESGLASGVVNTAFMMGGSLGLAVLASLAAVRTEHLLAVGVEQASALNGGYHLAFLVGAISVALAALTSGVFLRDRTVVHSAVLMH